MSAHFTTRWASEQDLDSLREIMRRSIAELQKGFLTPEQIEASNAVMGLDTQLVMDGTYLVVEENGEVVGCGGWSRRATLYGGDHSTPLRNSALLDPALDAARIRAMYTHPDHARRGIGRLILKTCEQAAASEGFTTVELMSTMSGVPLYTASGYTPLEPHTDMVDGVEVPLVRMRKAL